MHLSIIHLSPGDKIIYQGENIEALYFIENGSVEVKHGDALVGLIGEYLLTHGVGYYCIETSPLICSANQWTGFYAIGTSVMKELT